MLANKMLKVNKFEEIVLIVSVNRKKCATLQRLNHNSCEKYNLRIKRRTLNLFSV